MADQVVTIAAALTRWQELAAVSDSARLDTQLLLAYVLQRPRSYLYAWPEHCLNVEQQASFDDLLARRQNGEPVAYLTGEREFWSLPLKVSPATLIPRPETETLVEQCLGLPLAGQAEVLDLGTGTGAIALALASERPAWRITAVDKQAEAVSLAQANARALGLERVQVLRSDWYSAVVGRQFDLIVANPPYIAADDPHLQQGDVAHEPRSALVADNNGLADISHIIAAAPLCRGGWLVLEHGWQQAAAVRQLLVARGFAAISTCCDLAGQERVSQGQWGANNA